jgi:protein-S-isoprenylcysteine O-methyltransferase Ste14
MSVLKGAKAALIGTAPLAVLLLVTAGLVPHGTWVWQRGLIFVAGFGSISFIGNIALAVWRPSHFEVRQQSVVATKEKRQPVIDAVGSALLLAFGAGWVAFIPLDVFWLHLSPRPPVSVAVVGGLAALIGAALYPVAAWENRFATPNVQDQSGQRVVDTGIYAVIRHPIYLANLLLVGGAALWLGSTAAVVGVAVVLAFTIGRIRIEEAHLLAELPGYDDYARRVRARLIPFVI